MLAQARPCPADPVLTRADDTDTPNPGTMFGARLHRELQLLGRCRITLAQARNAATAAAARVLNLADRGHTAPGQRAALMLVSGDPLTYITATQAIERIWWAGVPTCRRSAVPVDHPAPSLDGFAEPLRLPGAWCGVAAEPAEGAPVAAIVRITERWHRAPVSTRNRQRPAHTLGTMSEPARELPVDEPKLLAEAVDDARLGVITHLTIRGERVAAIVPETMLDALRAAEDAEEADAAMDEPGESVSLEELEAEFGR